MRRLARVQHQAEERKAVKAEKEIAGIHGTGRLHTLSHPAIISPLKLILFSSFLLCSTDAFCDLLAR